MVAGDVSATHFDQVLIKNGARIERTHPRILQLNTGKLCNLTCVHCHVNAGPKRKEIIEQKTLGKVLDWLANSTVKIVDLTGGTPEMIPHFRDFVLELRALGCTVMNRCNLTILNEPGYEWVADFHAKNSVHIIASMPCYSPENVNAQRGDGVFDSSISALQELNKRGYGLQSSKPLDLVYNPVGDTLPPDQTQLEADYKRELDAHFGIKFNKLYAIANMPIARFASYLKRQGKLESYLQLLVDNFNAATIPGLMCRDTISVDWQGSIYDCDFNQQLGMALKDAGEPIKLWDIDASEFTRRPILTGNHCFGCTAGQGSSCGGSTL